MVSPPVTFFLRSCSNGEQDLLGILEWHVPVLSLLARVHSYRADNELLLGVHLNELLLPGNLVAHWGH